MVNAVLGGALECSLIRKIAFDLNNKSIETDHVYYRSLYRELEENAFIRAATIMSLVDMSFLANVDWAPGMGGVSKGITTPKIEEFGWKLEWESSEKYKQIRDFAKKFIKYTVFDSISYNRIHCIPDFNEDYINQIGVNYIIRILSQISAAEQHNALLFMPPRDEEILRQLSSYAASHPPAFAMPDFTQSCRSSEEKSLTLLAFQPPDALSILPVRKDRAVRRYADRVMELWNEPDPIKRERAAVYAMREAIEADEVRGRVTTVFEVSVWALKVLGYMGTPFVGAVGDMIDGADLVRESEKKANGWLMIRTCMNDISLRDYLKRTGNI